jgi:hypothetical protein
VVSSGRPARRGRRRREPGRGAVPFALALGRDSGHSGLDPQAQARLRSLQARLAGELARLDAACWKGSLDARGLARFQELRAACSRVDRAIEGDDEAVDP